MKTVAFFNHKGGVGKTTLVYNVGLALATQGHRVVFVDLDAQANLTAAAISPERLEKMIPEGQTIYSSLRPVVDGTGGFEEPPTVQIRDTAWVVPGDIRLSEYEEICPQGWVEALAGNARGFQVSTTIHRLVRAAAAKVGATFALLDLGPNVGALNRNSLLAADGFVIPLAPDLFSLTALPSVGKSTSLWVQEWESAKSSIARRSINLPYEVPMGRPSPLGYISQQFAVYRAEPAAAYRKWIERIPEAYEAGVQGVLAETGIAIPPGETKIGEVRNLSSLIPMAQRTQRAIFELSGSEARGAQFIRARDTYGTFNSIAVEMSTRLDWLENFASSSS